MKLFKIANKMFCPVFIIFSMIDYFKGNVAVASHLMLIVITSMILEIKYSKESDKHEV